MEQQSWQLLHHKPDLWWNNVCQHFTENAPNYTVELSDHNLDALTVDSGAKIRGLLPSSLPLRNAYMPAARHHDALWHASVSFASAMSQIFQGVSVDPVSLIHKGDTIRAINSELSDLSHPIADETIAAVQCLASIEVSLLSSWLGCLFV